MGQDVFISHASKDKTLVEFVRTEFEERHGLTCWTAPRNIPPGRSWPQTIADAIEHTGMVLLLTSDAAMTSPHVAREVAIAASHAKPLLPIRLGDVSVEGPLEYWLAGLQWYDYHDTIDAEACARLAEEVRHLLGMCEGGAPHNETAMEKFTISYELVEHSTPEDFLPRDADTRVSRSNPACIIVLLDCSRSMNERIGGGSVPRRVVVTDQTNYLFEELVDQSLTPEGALPYFFVAAIGYGDVGDRDVGSLLPPSLGDTEIVSIVDLPENVVRWAGDEEAVRLPDGSEKVQAMDRAVWIESRPFIRGRTLAKDAFVKALELCERWVAARPDALPPLVLNITDGGYDRDQDPSEQVRMIQEIATPHGNALVFNCHLSDHDVKPTFFPTEEEAQDFSTEMTKLFEQSSPLPRAMVARAQDLGYELDYGARGYVYNAEVVALVDFFALGTIGRGRT